MVRRAYQEAFVFRISLTFLPICANVFNMSEKTQTKIDILKSKAFKAAAIGGTVIASLATIEHFTEHTPHAGRDKVYIAKAGDTEWGLAERAYPKLDPREVVGLIQSQESPEDRQSHTLQPGERIYFSSDSQLGTEANAVATSER
jgi:hypothetical protein